MRLVTPLLLIAALLVPTGAHAADRVVAATLDNGLRVLLLEDHRSPIVSFQVWYRVGSRNEQRGATGIAHFLEHLMFKGTPTHGPKQFARLVEENGGQDNAFTSQDVTSYFVNIAADKLDLVIELEADRMQNLTLDPKEIASEREVVIEERRTRTEDDPGGFLGEEVGSIAFKAHPYGYPIIGWMEDIKRITPDEIRAFYKTYYVPNNAIVVAVEPSQNGERRVAVKKQAELPIVYLAWHVPSQRSNDAPALEVLSTILAGGRASRLYRDLVYQRQLALEAGGDYSYFAIDPNLFWFWATPMPGQTAETLEKELIAHMDRLKSEPVTEEELARAKNQIEAAMVFQEDSIHRRASLLARFEVIGGFTLKDSFIARIRAVTAADLTRVASTWFAPDKKSIGILQPKE